MLELDEVFDGASKPIPECLKHCGLLPTRISEVVNKDDALKISPFSTSVRVGAVSETTGLSHRQFPKCRFPRVATATVPISSDFLEKIPNIVVTVPPY